jgi:hypothetical protein
MNSFRKEAQMRAGEEVVTKQWKCRSCGTFWEDAKAVETCEVCGEDVCEGVEENGEGKPRTPCGVVTGVFVGDPTACIAAFRSHEQCESEQEKMVAAACSKERILARIRRSKPKAKKGKGDAKKGADVASP